MNHSEVLDSQKINQSNQEDIHADIHAKLDKSLDLSMCKTCGILGFDNAIRESD